MSLKVRNNKRKGRKYMCVQNEELQHIKAKTKKSLTASKLGPKSDFQSCKIPAGGRLTNLQES